MHDVCCVLSCFSPVWLFVTLWTAAHQAPMSMGFSRQEYWCALPCPPPGDLPDPEIKPKSHVSCIGRRVLYHQGHLESPNAWYSFQMWKTGLGLARLAVKELLLFRTWLSQSLWALRLGRLLQTKSQEKPGSSCQNESYRGDQPLRSTPCGARETGVCPHPGQASVPRQLSPFCGWQPGEPRLKKKNPGKF